MAKKKCTMLKASLMRIKNGRHETKFATTCYPMPLLDWTSGRSRYITDQSNLGFKTVGQTVIIYCVEPTSLIWY